MKMWCGAHRTNTRGVNAYPSHKSVGHPLDDLLIDLPPGDVDLYRRQGQPPLGRQGLQGGYEAGVGPVDPG